jgi:hypothetical protein
MDTHTHTHTHKKKENIWLCQNQLIIQLSTHIHTQNFKNTRKQKKEREKKLKNRTAVHQMSLHISIDYLLCKYEKSISKRSIIINFIKSSQTMKHNYVIDVNMRTRSLISLF